MSDSCKTCGLPKQSSKSGRLSQFVLICTCNLDLPTDEKQAITIHICKSCGKMIRKGRKGSITQFIFRSDICDCDRPEPSESIVPKDQSEVAIIEEGDEDELALDSGIFPTERYKPLKELGSGAHGSVYLARDRILNKKVAVKILKVISDEQLVQFQDEAKATSLLNHPNIVSVFDFGVLITSTPYMVLEYFESTTLADLMERDGQITWSRGREIVIEVLKALAYSHKNGVFHRDLKPANILLSDSVNSDVKVKLIDFGVAKVTELTGKLTEYQGKTLAGTPSYMSPDPVLGYEYSAASEIYSLGCVVFEALTGKLPFYAESPLELLSLHAQTDAPSLSSFDHLEIPIEADEFVSKCLEKDVSNRFGSADEALLFLDGVFESHEEHTDNSNKITKAEKSKARKLILPVLGTSLLVLALSVFASQFFFSPEPEKVKKQATVDLKQLLLDNKITVLKKGKIRWHILEGKITNNQLKILKELKADHVDIKNKSINENQMDSLVELPLIALDARGSNLNDSNLRKLALLNKLRVLLLDKCKNITAKGLSELKTIETLELLALSETNLKHEGLVEVSKNKNIKLLHIARNKDINDAVTPILMSMEKLVVVGLGATNISSKSLEILQKHPTIRGFGLANLDLKDNMLPKKFKKDLCSLDLSSNPITDKSLAKILSLPKLLYLSVNACDGFSIEALNRLNSKLSLSNGKIFLSDRVGILGGGATDSADINSTYLPPEFYYETDPKKATEMFLNWSNMLGADSF